MTRVLIADELSPAAVAVLEDRDILVDVQTGLCEADLAAVIGDYDGLDPPNGPPVALVANESSAATDLALQVVQLHAK